MTESKANTRTLNAPARLLLLYLLDLEECAGITWQVAPGSQCLAQRVVTD